MPPRRQITTKRIGTTDGLKNSGLFKGMHQVVIPHDNSNIYYNDTIYIDEESINNLWNGRLKVLRFAKKYWDPRTKQYMIVGPYRDYQLVFRGNSYFDGSDYIIDNRQPPGIDKTIDFVQTNSPYLTTPARPTINIALPKSARPDKGRSVHKRRFGGKI